MWRRRRRRRQGVKAARRAAFVLVAGGLGERLGYGGIKVARCCFVIGVT